MTKIASPYFAPSLLTINNRDIFWVSEESKQHNGLVSERECLLVGFEFKK
jgi:hypothetical protein